MEKDEVYYGVLMNKKYVNGNICLFVPNSIVEGTIEENKVQEYIQKYFVSSIMDVSYLIYDDLDILNFDEEMVVGYTISKEELKNKYPDSTIKEALTLYFDEISSQVTFGYYCIDDDKMHIYKMNLMQTFEDAVSKNRLKREEIKNLNFQDLSIKTYIEPSVLEEILTLKSMKEIKAYISDILEKIDNKSDILEGFDIDSLKQDINYLISEYQKAIEQNSSSPEYVDLAKKAIKKLKKCLQCKDLETLETQFTNVKENEIAEIQNILNKINPTDLDVSKMKKYFDERIIGQEEAKKDVISALKMNSLTENPNDKNNVLLIGPTGSGKTLLAEISSKYLKLPMVIIDTTQLSMTGYVGSTLENFLLRLIDAANGDIEKAKKGVVVFDEIDKRGFSGKEDIIGAGALNSLLPFIQGTCYDVEISQHNKISFDTSGLTIFATGAFTNVASAVKNNQIGFNSSMSELSKEDIKYEKITIEDLVKKGNMPIELIGRFSTITQLTGHTADSLKKILTDSKISVLNAEKAKLKKLGILLKWTQGYLNAVAGEAIKLKTGARSLKMTVEKSIKEVRWYVLNNLDKYKAIILTEKTVSDNLDCELIDKNGISHNLKELLNPKMRNEEKRVKRVRK